MCLIGFSYIASASVIAPILSIYIKDVMKAPVEAVGLVTSAFFISSALAKLILGFFAGGKRTISFLLVSFIIFSACPALYPFTEDTSTLTFIRAVQGFSYAFIGTASLILAALTISSLERDKGVGVYTAFLSLGLLAGPLITTFSIPFFGVSNTFFFAALVGLVGIYASYILNREFSRIERDWQVIGVKVEKEPLKRKISAIIRNRMFAIALIGNFAFFMLFGVLLAYAPLYMKETLNLNNELVSVNFLIYYVATTITRLNVAKILQKIGKDRLLLLGTSISVLSALFLAYSRSSYVFAAVFAVLGAVQGVIFPVGSMLIAEHIHPLRNVLANSLYMMGIDLGQGIAPLITAGVAAQYGLTSTFVVSAVISVIAAIGIFWQVYQVRKGELVNMSNHG